MDETVERLRELDLPFMAELYLALKSRNVELLGWIIPARERRVSFFVKHVMEKNFKIYTEEYTNYLQLSAGETTITFGGKQHHSVWKQRIKAYHYIAIFSLIAKEVPFHIRRQLNNICRTMLPFSEPLQI
jgi:hypothetical protein